MVETISLRAPVLIDGEQVRELTYDIDSITPDQFVEAEVLAANIAASIRKVSTKVVELDTGFHYYLGVMAVIAANPTYSVQDVERVKGPDVMKIMRVGRNFTTSDAEEDEDEASASITDAADEEEEDFLPTLE